MLFLYLYIFLNIKILLKYFFKALGSTTVCYGSRRKRTRILKQVRKTHKPQRQKTDLSVKCYQMTKISFKLNSGHFLTGNYY